MIERKECAMKRPAFSVCSILVVLAFLVFLLGAFFHLARSGALFRVYQERIPLPSAQGPRLLGTP